MISDNVFSVVTKSPRGTYKIVGTCHNEDIEYSITNLFTNKRFTCQSLWALIKAIENDMTANKFPQNSIAYRAWGHNSHSSNRADKKAIEVENNEKVELKAAGLTLMVKVVSRQNATWQGTIQWFEGRQTRQFRSVNELMLLIDELAESNVQKTVASC